MKRMMSRPTTNIIGLCAIIVIGLTGCKSVYSDMYSYKKNTFTPPAQKSEILKSISQEDIKRAEQQAAIAQPTPPPAVPGLDPGAAPASGIPGLDPAPAAPATPMTPEAPPVIPGL
jgi:hypothetical protein